MYYKAGASDRVLDILYPSGYLGRKNPTDQIIIIIHMTFTFLCGNINRCWMLYTMGIMYRAYIHTQYYLWMDGWVCIETGRRTDGGVEDVGRPAAPI